MIDFVMKRDRIEFLDALKLLGGQAGIEMPQFGGSPQKSGEKQVLLDMQSAACAFFEKLLSHPEQGLAARDYLRTSGRSIPSRSSAFRSAWLSILGMRCFEVARPQVYAAAAGVGGLVKPRDSTATVFTTPSAIA